MYRFTPPSKNKIIYISVNIMIALAVVISAILFYGHAELFGIPIAVWCLFNGLWSINPDWYSWFHRRDKSSYAHGVWLIWLILGILMSVILLIFYLLG